MHTQKIFLASSSELKKDRQDFRNFISVENDTIHTQGIYFEIVQWEYHLDSISSTRLQDEYNKKIRECDIVICLLHNKVGKYTNEEFDIAYNEFKKNNRPLIWTYFKSNTSSSQSENEAQTLLAFKEKLNKIGHFYTVYSNIEQLSLHFKRQLEYVYGQSLHNITPQSLANSYKSLKETTKKEVLLALDTDIDLAFDKLDSKFLGKNPIYYDLCKEYFAQPNNFSLATFRSKLRRFIVLNWID